MFLDFLDTNLHVVFNLVYLRSYFILSTDQVKGERNPKPKYYQHIKKAKIKKKNERKLSMIQVVL